MDFPHGSTTSFDSCLYWCCTRHDPPNLSAAARLERARPIMFPPTDGPAPRDRAAGSRGHDLGGLLRWTRPSLGCSALAVPRAAEPLKGRPPGGLVLAGSTRSRRFCRPSHFGIRALIRWEAYGVVPLAM